MKALLEIRKEDSYFVPLFNLVQAAFDLLHDIPLLSNTSTSAVLNLLTEKHLTSIESLKKWPLKFFNAKHLLINVCQDPYLYSQCCQLFKVDAFKRDLRSKTSSFRRELWEGNQLQWLLLQYIKIDHRLFMFCFLMLSLILLISVIDKGGFIVAHKLMGIWPLGAVVSLGKLFYHLEKVKKRYLLMYFHFWCFAGCFDFADNALMQFSILSFL